MVRRFLFQILRGPKERWRPPSNPRPTTPQQTHPCEKVPNGHTPNCPSPHQQRGLVHCYRHERRLLPCQYPQVSQKVPPLQNRRPGLPVPMSPIRPVNCTQGLHQMRGPRSSLPSSAGHSSLPLHRRLADCSALQAGRGAGHKLHGASHGESRPTDQLQEIEAEPVPTHRVHRSSTRLTHSEGVCAPQKAPRYHEDCNDLPPHQTDTCKEGPETAGAHGIHHSRDSSREAKTSLPSVMVPTQLRPGNRRSTQKTLPHHRAGAAATMVDLLPNPDHGKKFLPSPTHQADPHRCEPHGVGSSLRDTHGEQPLVPRRSEIPHQSPRTPCHLEGPQVLRKNAHRPSDTDRFRQHHCHSLHKQTRRHPVSDTTLPGSPALGMVPRTTHLSHWRPHPRETELAGRSVEQAQLDHPRMGAGPHSLPIALPAMGNSGSGPFCLRKEPQVPPLLFQGGDRTCLRGRRIHGTVGPGLPLCLPPVPPHTEGPHADTPTTSSGNPNRTGMAQTDVVPVTPTTILRVTHASELSITTSHGERQPTSLRPTQPAPHGLAHNARLQMILDMARRPSTRRSYAAKYTRFCTFLHLKDKAPCHDSLVDIMEYLLHLAEDGLSLASIKVHLAAVVAHSPTGSVASTAFRDQTVKKFLKGLQNAFPPVKAPPPQWSLSTVLNALTKGPFEPLATADLRLLTWKTAFLVAITSARRASEMTALRVDPPFTNFYCDRVVLHPDISFLPKVVSDFHLHQSISLPAFFQNPTSDQERTWHTLDVKRSLLFYISRTKQFRKTQRLFIAYGGKSKGDPITSQRFSKWISSTIYLAYEIARLPPPPHVRPHSTRAVASSTAFLDGVPVDDICKAATWSRPSTFVKHYRMDTRATADARLGRVVLTRGLQASRL